VERTLNYEHVDQFSVGWMVKWLIDRFSCLDGQIIGWLVGWLVS